MDDVLTGSDSEDSLLDLQNVIHEKSSAKFPLRKYLSNSQKLMNSLPEQLLDRSFAVAFEDKKDKKFSNTLRIKWRFKSDLIEISINTTALAIEITKREILLFIAKQFDPIGLLSPVTIRGKIILQELMDYYIDISKLKNFFNRSICRLLFVRKEVIRLLRC